MTEIDAFLDDLDRLAATAPVSEPRGFYSQLLAASAAALGADAAEFRPVTGSGDTIAWQASGIRVDRLLAGAMHDRVGREATPRIVASDTDGAPVVACPIEGPGRVAGVLALRLGLGAAGAPQRTLDVATAIAEVAGRYELRRAAQRIEDAESRLARVESVLVRLHSSRGLAAAAREAADTGRHLVGCDRLSVLADQGGWRVVAVSGVNRVSRRSDAARAMTRLAGDAATVGGELRVGAGAEPLAPPLAERIDAYRDATGVRRLLVLPCRVDPEADSIERPTLLTLAEWFDEDEARDAEPLLAALARHLGVAAKRERGKLAKRFSASRVMLASLGLGILLAAGVVASLIPTTLWVSVEGRFEPADHARVFAPLDGVVEELLVEQADQVAAGQPLVRLASDDLQITIEEVAEAIAATEAEIATAETAKLRASLPGRGEDADPTALASRIAALREQLTHQRRRETLLAGQAEKLLVTSPIDGEVVSWRPGDYLAGRPVRRGQRLLEVAAGDRWRLVLEAPDHRAGHVLRAGQDGLDLAVEYVVRSDPAITHRATVSRIAEATDTNADGEPVVRIVAVPDAPTLSNARGGLGVSAKIDCGEHALGYVWLHEAIEAIRRRWF